MTDMLDFYKNAYPILRHYGYPSTVYVVSGLVGTDNVWDSRNENFAEAVDGLESRLLRSAETKSRSVLTRNHIRS